MAGFVCFDTETTGFTHNDLPLDHVDQPWPVQIAAAFFEWPDDSEPDFGKMYRGGINLIINAPVDKIPEKAFAVHGIDKNRAANYGFKPITGLTMLLAMLAMTKIVVAHHIAYDQEIITILQRRCLPAHGNPFAGKKMMCTKEMADPILNLPATERMKETGYGNKSKAPNLQECHKHFFGYEFDGAHDGKADMMACARIFIEMLKLKTPAHYGLAL